MGSVAVASSLLPSHILRQQAGYPPLPPAPAPVPLRSCLKKSPGRARSPPKSLSFAITAATTAATTTTATAADRMSSTAPRHPNTIRLGPATPAPARTLPPGRRPGPDRSDITGRLLGLLEYTMSLAPVLSDDVDAGPSAPSSPSASWRATHHPASSAISAPPWLNTLNRLFARSQDGLHGVSKFAYPPMPAPHALDRSPPLTTAPNAASKTPQSTTDNTHLGPSSGRYSSLVSGLVDVFVMTAMSAGLCAVLLLNLIVVLPLSDLWNGLINASSRMGWRSWTVVLCWMCGLLATRIAPELVALTGIVDLGLF